MSTTLTESDQGKRIVAANGSDLGLIVEVRDGTPYVDADPNVLESVQAELDWGEPRSGAYPLPTADIAMVTDEEVRLE